MRAVRAGGLVAGAAGGLLLVLSSVAWGCTIQAPLIGVSPASGQPASTVTVRGQGVARALDGTGVPVEIRWNSTTGPKLGEVMSDSRGLFSATVAIPVVAPELYSVVAVASGARLGQTTFEVSAPPGQAATTGLATASPWNEAAATSVPEAQAGPGSGMAAGVGVLGGGLVAVAGGFAAATLRRRRRVAPAEARLTR